MADVFVAAEGCSHPDLPFACSTALLAALATPACLLTRTVGRLELAPNSSVLDNAKQRVATILTSIGILTSRPAARRPSRGGLEASQPAQRGGQP
ncbi:hypothetical protein BQ8794_180181 [Mesorhizobium prunaredense]|uniref:Uncharacterized protein n=1 Tax=Mesorhizobium prunaredense TaxID=1631249 RepID=A0A1R3V7R6_9HYPH|nr:hypothetical protein BQ8794_180181 [Mesorhizobium prunaredense]